MRLKRVILYYTFLYFRDFKILKNNFLILHIDSNNTKTHSNISKYLQTSSILFQNSSKDIQIALFSDSENPETRSISHFRSKCQSLAHNISSHSHTFETHTLI